MGGGLLRGPKKMAAHVGELAPPQIGFCWVFACCS